MDRPVLILTGGSLLLLMQTLREMNVKAIAREVTEEVKEPPKVDQDMIDNLMTEMVEPPVYAGTYFRSEKDSFRKLASQDRKLQREQSKRQGRQRR